MLFVRLATAEGGHRQRYRVSVQDPGVLAQLDPITLLTPTPAQRARDNERAAVLVSIADRQRRQHAQRLPLPPVPPKVGAGHG